METEKEIFRDLWNYLKTYNNPPTIHDPGCEDFWYKAGKDLTEMVSRKWDNFRQLPQDGKLASNQQGCVCCGDNGIFCGYPVTHEQKLLTCIAKKLYRIYPFDGKYILDGKRLIICQSNAPTEELCTAYPKAEINPLGDWTGGPDVDTGATNRKLGSDMADSVTGGGLHGKDLSKADVSVNIWAWLKAQETGKPVEVCCAIGDDHVGGVPFSEMVETAREYINQIGGFERFAEWGLVR